MPIQWFPGHMHAARKQAAETLQWIDVVIEVVDARLPEASSNPLIRRLREERQRPALKLLNKADLADAQVTAAWLDFYRRRDGDAAVALSCKNAADVARIPSYCRRLAPHRSDNTKPLRILIMGIPNVGKSTLLNALVRRRVAAVGDEPAITRAEQRLDIDPGMSIIDMPGLMWPKIDHESDGYMLAASHAIGANEVLPEEVAGFLADILAARYPGALAARYGRALDGLDGHGVIESIARRRGCLLRGGKPDLEKAALILLDDYRSGRLGRIDRARRRSRNRAASAPRSR